MIKNNTSRTEYIWVIFLLLFGFGLRLINIDAVPPGLTHDEAVHGISAWSIVEGARPLYFSVANGREPLYDYAVAGLMSILGPTTLALRLTSIFFSMLLSAGTYALVKHLFNRRIALLTLAGLTLGFWPLMLSRHGLRTITMPTLLVLGVLFWLISDQKPVTGDQTSEPEGNILITGHRSLVATPSSFYSGLCLGLMFYTYIPARVMWILLPLMLLIWYFRDRARFEAMWPRTLLILGIMGLVAAPLMSYLYLINPEAEARVSELASPLSEALNGNLLPLLNNLGSGIRMVISVGDEAWRYNVAGRALLPPFLAALFGLGILVSGRVSSRSFVSRKPKADHDTDQQLTAYASQTAIPSKPFILHPSAFILFWLLLGLLPVFITGSFLGTTQAAAALPVLYIFPALFIDWLWDKSANQAPLPLIVVLLLYTYIGLDTIQTYFVTWGQHPEVRLQYEAHLVETLDRYEDEDAPIIAFSEDKPGPFHDGAVAFLTYGRALETLRLFRGRRGVLLPSPSINNKIELLGTTLSDTNYDLLDYIEIIDETFLFPEDELYYLFSIREVSGFILEKFEQPDEPILFGDDVSLIGWDVTPSPPDGAFTTVYTLWEVAARPETELVFFTQVLRDGAVIAQADQLDAPASQWYPGDQLLQHHPILITPENLRATDQIIIGIYVEGEPSIRLPVTVNGEPQQDFYTIHQ